jgi:hypothetical protein
VARWIPEAHVAEVKHQRGNYLHRMGTSLFPACYNHDMQDLSVQPTQNRIR